MGDLGEPRVPIELYMSLVSLYSCKKIPSGGG